MAVPGRRRGIHHRGRAPLFEYTRRVVELGQAKIAYAYHWKGTGALIVGAILSQFFNDAASWLTPHYSPEPGG